MHPKEVDAGLTLLRQNGVSCSVTAVSSETLSAGSRWPFPLPFESRNSIPVDVLLASGVVRSYIDRLATFLGYPRGAVQVMAARLYEAQITAKTLSEAGFKTFPLVLAGDAKTIILDEAANWHSDLIVLGSHGRKGLGRFLLGSVSEAVARYTCCSVEIVRLPSE